MSFEEMLNVTALADAVAPTPCAYVSPDQFRQGMRLLPGAVSVVTAQDGARRAGITATSVCSLSAEPPTLLVCVNRSSSSWPAFARARRFAINVLAADQGELADCFAGRTGASGDERFTTGLWSQSEPVLSDALAAFLCDVEDRIERHSHAILIGSVTGVRIGRGSSALLYWRGCYESLGWTAQEVENAIGLRR
jgi:flavin reductase (DIM6/NTAB) family NADH-FMN oxidoreductase RutF